VVDIRLSLPEIFYLFGTFHGVFLAILLVASRRAHKANIYLALLLVLFSFYLFENTLSSSGYITRLPHLLYTTIPLIYLIAPLFYTYVRSLIDKDFRLRPVDAVLLLPFLVELLILWPVYGLSGDIKRRIYEATVDSAVPWRFNIYFMGYLIYVVTSLFYFLASFRLLRAAKSEKPVAAERITWLKQASLGLFGYVVLSMILSFLPFVISETRLFVYHTSLVVQILLIQAVGYVAFVRPSIFRESAEKEPAKKYRFSSLEVQTMSERKLALVEWMRTEPYLDPDLSSEQLATSLGLSRHHLSQLLTESLQTTFYDFINQYRVEKAMQLLQSDNYREAKILHIAYDCGFSNKSTFLRSFRKVTGLTPTEFRESTEKQVSLN